MKSIAFKCYKNTQLKKHTVYYRNTLSSKNIIFVIITQIIKQELLWLF